MTTPNSKVTMVTIRFISNGNKTTDLNDQVAIKRGNEPEGRVSVKTFLSSDKFKDLGSAEDRLGLITCYRRVADNKLRCRFDNISMDSGWLSNIHVRWASPRPVAKSLHNFVDDETYSDKMVKLFSIGGAEAVISRVLGGVTSGEKIMISAGKFASKDKVKTHIPEETRLIRHSIFTRNMDVVMKAAQSVTKSNGIVAGALVLLAGTIGAAMDAIDNKALVGDPLTQYLADYIVSEGEHAQPLVPQVISAEDMRILFEATYQGQRSEGSSKSMYQLLKNKMAK